MLQLKLQFGDRTLCRISFSAQACWVGFERVTLLTMLLTCTWGPAIYEQIWSGTNYPDCLQHQCALIMEAAITSETSVNIRCNIAKDSYLQLGFNVQSASEVAPWVVYDIEIYFIIGVFLFYSMTSPIYKHYRPIELQHRRAHSNEHMGAWKIKHWEDNPRTQSRLSDKIQQSRSSQDDHVKMGKESFFNG
jgi:hypothetical protein